VNSVSNLVKCTYCGAEMIERTNDNKLECLNCGTPFTMPTRVNYARPAISFANQL